MAAQPSRARAGNAGLRARRGRPRRAAGQYVDRAGPVARLLETALTARFHDANIQFRNLGWSGDTVFGEARAGFDTAAEGFAHLKQHVLDLKPTVILLNYGANESFAGRDGLPTFVAGLTTLLAALDETGARIVFISPTPQENLGPPLPDPAQHNRDLQLYTAAIAKVAAERNALLVNLFELLGKKLQPPSRNPADRQRLALDRIRLLARRAGDRTGLGLPPERWIARNRRRDQQHRRRRHDRSAMPSFRPRRIRFQAVDGALPFPLRRRVRLPAAAWPCRRGSFTCSGCRTATTASRSTASIGDAPAEAWAERRRLRQWARFRAGGTTAASDSGPRTSCISIAGGRRTSPTCSAFASTSRDNNAVEIPQFDPLVEAKETEIHTLAAPVAHRYEIIKVDRHDATNVALRHRDGAPVAPALAGRRPR